MSFTILDSCYVSLLSSNTNVTALSQFLLNLRIYLNFLVKILPLGVLIRQFTLVMIYNNLSLPSNFNVRSLSLKIIARSLK